MALTLEQLHAQRDAILTKMGGHQTVTEGDRSVTHRPQADLEAALQRVSAEIAKLSPQTKTFTIQTSRGL